MLKCSRMNDFQRRANCRPVVIVRHPQNSTSLAIIYFSPYHFFHNSSDGFCVILM